MHHHGIEHEWEEYLPMLGEVPLRVRSGTLFGRLTVPVLLRADDTSILDSADIARFADEIGSGSPLFPDGLDSDIQQWVERAERVHAGGRQSVFANIAHSAEAQEEAAPSWVPGAARRPVARIGAAYLELKYSRKASLQETRSRMRQTLLELRDALAQHDGDSVLSSQSFADMAMATALQFIRPVANSHVLLRPATRDAWTMPEVADEFSDLLAWRDSLFDRLDYPGAPSCKPS